MSPTALIPAPYRWLALAALVVAVALAAYSSGEQAGSERVQTAWDKSVNDINRIAQAALTRALSERDDLARKLEAADDRHLTNLQESQRETNRLRDCISAGTCGLRILARCPASADVPQAAASASVDLGAGAELAPAAGRAYFALRDGIDRASAQIAACQEQLTLRTAGQ